MVNNSQALSLPFFSSKSKVIDIHAKEVRENKAKDWLMGLMAIIILALAVMLTLEHTGRQLAEEHAAFMSTELSKTKAEVVKLNQQVALLQGKINNALIPEATVGEAFNVHVATPVASGAKTAYNYVADVAYDAASGVKSLWNKAFE